ncbi:MAG TPA: hypothetical protein VL978_11165 [Puia sp.]|nr:hypothetical protein [Puia sp.]
MRTFILFTAAFMGIGINALAQNRIIHYKPDGTIRISLTNSEVNIAGYDGSDVVITDLRGMNGAGDLSVVENGGTLVINKTSESRGNFLIKIPRKSNLYYEEEFREPGKILISNIDGRADVKSWVSEIVMTNVTGPVKAVSQAADISVAWTAVSAKDSSSIVTLGRSVKVILPPTAKVDLNLDVLSGKVTSDFDLGAENRAALLRTGSERNIRHRINGGNTGIDIKANEIDIQQAKG